MSRSALSRSAVSRPVLPLATVLALTAAPVAANPIADVICAPTNEMTERLITQFGESRIGTGVRDPEQVMEIWAADDGQSWTMVATYARGVSCIVAMGEYWQTSLPADPA